MQDKTDNSGPHAGKQNTDNFAKKELLKQMNLLWQFKVKQNS